MQPEAVRESLQLVAAAITELHLRDGPDQVADDLGDQDLAAPGLAGHARGDVDRGAEDVTRLFDDLAGVDADADLQLPLGILFAVLGDGALDLDRAFDRMPGGTEADHDAVTEALDAAACMLGDL